METEVIEVVLVPPPPQSFGNAASAGKNRKALDGGRVWVMMQLWQLNRHGNQQLLVTVCVSSERGGRTLSIDVFYSQDSSHRPHVTFTCAVCDCTRGGHIFNEQCEEKKRKKSVNYLAVFTQFPSTPRSR